LINEIEMGRVMGRRREKGWMGIGNEGEIGGIECKRDVFVGFWRSLFFGFYGNWWIVVNVGVLASFLEESDWNCDKFIQLFRSHWNDAVRFAGSSAEALTRTAGSSGWSGEALTRTAENSVKLAEHPNTSINFHSVYIQSSYFQSNQPKSNKPFIKMHPINSKNFIENIA
jgi:hypothetical protein